MLNRVLLTDFKIIINNNKKGDARILPHLPYFFLKKGL